MESNPSQQLMLEGAPAQPEARSALKSSVLEAVGSTPIVRLSRLFEESGLEVFGKLEALNPGGSIKDRAARSEGVV